MPNPLNLLWSGGRLDALVLRVRPRSDEVLDKLGFDAHWPAILPVSTFGETS